MNQMDPSPRADELRRLLFANPDLFAQKLDLAGQRAFFMRLSAHDIRNANFLDDRILTPSVQGQWIALSELNSALRDQSPRKPLHFIFHMGHTGSTLLSRLLEQCDGVLSLREPLPLRSLAEFQDFARERDRDPSELDNLVHDQTVLWARGWPETTAVVVKATSTAARIGRKLLTALPAAKAAYLSLELEPYLATLMAGENSHLDLTGHSAERMRRLQHLTGIDDQTVLRPTGLGELAAMSWTVEALTQAQLVNDVGVGVLRLDFEQVLSNLEGALGSVFSHFGLRGDAAHIARGDVPLQYSKAPQYKYTAGDRAQILRQARVEKYGEIRAGLKWVDNLAQRSPAITDLFSSA